MLRKFIHKLSYNNETFWSIGDLLKIHPNDVDRLSQIVVYYDKGNLNILDEPHCYSKISIFCNKTMSYVNLSVGEILLNTISIMETITLNRGL